MKIYRNRSGIESKEKLGRRLVLAGMVFFLIGWFASWWAPTMEPANNLMQFFQANWVYLSLFTLLAGLVFASTGSYYTNRFARRRWPEQKAVERPDEVVARCLKGFDNKYAYFACGLPANYVISGPCGVLVLAVKGDSGKVQVEGDRWREPFRISRIFTIFAREGIGRPQQDLTADTEKMSALLAEAGEDERYLNSTSGNNVLAEIPIAGAVLFINRRMQVEADGPTIPVLQTNDLKNFIRRRAKEINLPNNKVRLLNQYLAEQSTHDDT